MEDNNNTQFDRKRLTERAIDEFIGICRGIIFDGSVSYGEAENLLIWLKANPLVARDWTAKKIHDQLRRFLIDGELSSDNEPKLLTTLLEITGNPEVLMNQQNAPSALPLCSPAPDVYFKGAVFVITGNLKMGVRKKVIEQIQSLGGELVLKNVRLDTNFLIIGDVGSSAWMHSTHGRKIERAVELRDQKRTGINIISEDHFYNFIKAA